MPINPRERHLYIAGKLRFPCDFPKLGRLSVRQLIPASAESEARPSDPVIELMESFTDGRVLTRQVLACNVSGVFIPNDITKAWTSGDWADNGTWFTGHEFAVACAVLTDAIMPQVGCPTDACFRYGLVYLAEDVSVVNQYEFGSSAADSIDIVVCEDDYVGCCNPRPGGCKPTC